MWRCELLWKYFGNRCASKEIKGIWFKTLQQQNEASKNSLSLQKHFETFVFRLYLRLLFFISPTFLSLTQQFNLNPSFSAMSFQTSIKSWLSSFRADFLLCWIVKTRDKPDFTNVQASSQCFECLKKSIWSYLFSQDQSCLTQSCLSE